ncbi:MAG: OmpA family protein [Acidobacteriaceae bacterium]
MNIQRRVRSTCGLAVSLAMATSLTIAAAAQQQPPPPQGDQHATIQGLVIGRDGPNMSVKTADSPRLTVILSDSTKATQKGGGFLGLGRQDLGITQLVPGLQVKVEGAFNSDHQLLARKVTFSRSSMRTAQQIDAGLNPVAEQVAQAQDQLKSDRRDITQSQSDISKNSQDIDTTKQGLVATNQVTASNTQGIGKANQRFTTLDQYATKGSVTVNFRNGSALVSKKDRDQLTDFLQSSANTPGMMVQVQGYASKVGSAELNQRLSSERAEAVIAIIQQSGSIPLTSILAPAAMGVTDQVGNNHTRSGQAQNRRVVVTILVNKGITGDSNGSGDSTAPGTSTGTSNPTGSGN